MGNALKKEIREIYIKNLSFSKLKNLNLEVLGFSKKNKTTFQFKSKKFIFFSFLIEPKLVIRESKVEENILIEFKKIKINNLSNFLDVIKLKIFIEISNYKNGCRICKDYYFDKDITNLYNFLSERLIYKCLTEIINNIDQRINNIILNKLNNSSLNLKIRNKPEKFKVNYIKGYISNENLYIFILLFALLNILKIGEIIKIGIINLRFSISKNMNIVNALIYREMITRIDNSSMGILKLLISPLLAIVGFTGLKVIISQLNILDSFQFVVPGVILFFLFRQIVNRSLNAIKANSGILTYKQINPIHIVFARSSIEFFIYLVIFIILTLVLSFKLNYFFIVDLPLFILVFSLIFIFSFSVGILAMLISFKWEFFRELFSNFIMRPLWFTSGILFSIEQVPDYLKNILKFNPLFQAVEIIRYSTSYNLNSISEYTSLKYLLEITLVLLIICTITYNLTEKNLIRK